MEEVVQPKLGMWANSQRTAKKRLNAGDPSPRTTMGRVAKLEALGFEWVIPRGVSLL